MRNQLFAILYKAVSYIYHKTSLCNPRNVVCGFAISNVWFFNVLDIPSLVKYALSAKNREAQGGEQHEYLAHFSKYQCEKPDEV